MTLSDEIDDDIYASTFGNLFHLGGKVLRFVVHDVSGAVLHSQ